MSFFGYGKYDGDGTQSVQISFLEEIVGEKGILYDSKGKILEPMDYSEKIKLDKNFVEYSHNVLMSNKGMKKEFFPVVNDEDSALAMMMITDFFMVNNFWSDKLEKEVIKSKKYDKMVKILNEYAQDFDIPEKRLKIIETFCQELNMVRHSFLYPI